MNTNIAFITAKNIYSQRYADRLKLHFLKLPDGKTVRAYSYFQLPPGVTNLCALCKINARDNINFLTIVRFFSKISPIAPSRAFISGKINFIKRNPNGSRLAEIKNDKNLVSAYVWFWQKHEIDDGAECFCYCSICGSRKKMIPYFYVIDAWTGADALLLRKAQIDFLAMRYYPQKKSIDLCS